MSRDVTELNASQHFSDALGYDRWSQPLMAKLMIGIALTMLMTAQMAQGASKEEDAYVACLIGQAAVALHKKCDAQAAQTRAYKMCKFRGRLNQEGIEGIGDYVNMKVERMAQDCK